MGIILEYSDIRNNSGIFRYWEKFWNIQILGITLEYSDIGNNFAGTLMGIINALGNTMGFIAPTFTGLITNDHNDTAHWQVV